MAILVIIGFVYIFFVSWLMDCCKGATWLQFLIFVTGILWIPICFIRLTWIASKPKPKNSRAMMRWYEKSIFTGEQRKHLISSESYKHLVNFVRHKDINDETELAKLRNLLNSKGFQFNKREIELLVEYEVFRKEVTSNMPRTLREYCENFIKSYAYEYLSYKEFFVNLIKENHVDFNPWGIDKILKQTKKELEIADFETELASQKTITASGESIDKLTGHEFEHFLKGLFEKMGYTVTNTKLSGDQGADLIVSKAGEKIVVQAKKHTNKVTNKAIQEVVAAIKHYNADKGMVVTNNFFTRSAVELAKSNNVELIDRDGLNDLLKK